MKTIHRLDYLRGFVALYVVLYHLRDNELFKGLSFGFLFQFGQEAVIIFFLLSGFVIKYIQVKS
jgi:peptidoglycan/LPS O-acetylase OafA/YrhL